MEINIDRIKSSLNNKITKDEIIKVYYEFKFINNLVKLNLGIEDSIIKYFKNLLNIEVCKVEINKLNMEIRGYDNELILMKREGFDYLRGNGKLMNFLWSLDSNKIDELNTLGLIRMEESSEIKLKRFREKRDNISRDYNELDFGNISEWKI